MDRILLIDGNNFTWRANVSFGPPTKHEVCNECVNEKHSTLIHCKCGSPWHEEESFCYGEKYKLIFNFFRNLRPIIEQFAPDKCFFVLEGHPQFRYDLYGDYKANRIIKTASESRQKVYQSLDEIVRLLLLLPITVCRASDYECDDTIGSLCENMKDEHLTVVSNDSDFIQLLQKGWNNIFIYDSIKKVYMEAPTYPYVAWKAIAGDKSDNIPVLLTKQKALKAINDPPLFQKFMEVEENRANFSINRQLIEFREVPAEEILMQEGVNDFDALKREFALMKFESIINDKSWEKYTSTFQCIKF